MDQRDFCEESYVEAIFKNANQDPQSELKTINEGYLNGEQDSDLPILAKPGVKKPSSHQAERTYEAFKSPFTEEIINTSKEIHGELSQKTIQENQS